ncbi:MAG: hypothetical protein M0010_06030 [Actinomycetota bacterium]|nr:hypothetical protein [Actinomycetota bacterium]
MSASATTSSGVTTGRSSGWSLGRRIPRHGERSIHSQRTAYLKIDWTVTY